MAGWLLKATFHAAVLSFGCYFAIAQKASAEPVDVEIVLAVDISGSVSGPEYDLQMAGYANAFRDPSIQAALTSGAIGKVAVAMVLWADAAFPKYPTRWHVLDGAGAARQFADEIQTFHSHTGHRIGIGGGGTGIGDGIRQALQMMDSNGHSGTKKVIDVSGDGIETEPWFEKAIELPAARRMAQLGGVTINGLAILTDFPRLDEWYRKNVAMGPGNFVIEADSFDDFADAIMRKLFREFSSNYARRTFDSGAKFAEIKE